MEVRDEIVVLFIVCFHGVSLVLGAKPKCPLNSAYDVKRFCGERVLRMA